MFRLFGQPLAKKAHELLESWTAIPGEKTDKSIDADQLQSWIDEARQHCRNNDRLKICDLKVGRLLSYSPTNADGTWPCSIVCEAIETIETEEILQGFEIGIINQRGATTRGHNDGGEQERALAKKYATYADSRQISSPRTARVLRNIADHYTSDANQQDARAEMRF